MLAAVGDAIGYNNGSYEFNTDTQTIHSHVQSTYGGVPNIQIRGWRVSDDTVMHLATMRALVSSLSQQQQQLQSIANDDEATTIHRIMTHMAQEYIDCWDDMGGRAPGATCGSGVRYLQRAGTNQWHTVPFSSFGGGCGASMRAQAIGLQFHGEQWRDMLVAIGIESGRLTHNHPTGFMGSMVSAAFTAFAIEGIPVNQWGYHLMNDLIPRAMRYLQRANGGRDWTENRSAIKNFINAWQKMLEARGLTELNNSGPRFPDPYGIGERDEFYHQFAFRGWPGASGDDSVIIAYDALLGAGNNWEELMLRGALHGGDSDSTGTIAAAWFGALYGFHGVSASNYEQIEKREELDQLSKQIYQSYYHEDDHTSD